LNDLALRQPAAELARNAAPAMAELARVPLGKPLETLEEAVLYGRSLAMAGLLPDSLRDRQSGQIKVADVVLILCMGTELGMSPMQAINGIYVVKGRPMLSGQVWATRVRQAGHRLTVDMEYHPTSKRPLSAKATIVRGDDKTVHELTFSVWDARNAGLAQVNDDGAVMARNSRSGEKLPWEQYTATMLRYRAISHCSRYACPEVIYGTMGIEGEEYDDAAEDGFGEERSRFVAANTVQGTAQEQEQLAGELLALAGRMTGNSPTIADAFEEVREGDPESAKAALRKIHNRVSPREKVTEPGTAVREHDGEKTCEICGTRMLPFEHTGADYDHEPVWIVEPE
jgi:hypothetical protein